AGVVGDGAGVAVYFRDPVLAVAEDGDEGREGDDLVIGRSVRQAPGIIVRRFRKADLGDYVPVGREDEASVDDVDEIRRVGRQRGLDRDRRDIVRAAEHDEMLGHAPVLVALERGHRDKIVGEQPVGFYQRAFGGVERGVAEPVAQAQQVLLDGGLFGNVRVFFEVTFEEVEVGFVRDRDVRHFVDPFACNRKYRPTSLTYPRRIYMSSNVHCNDDCREASHLMKILSIFIFLAYVSVLQSPRLFAAEAKPTASGDWEKTVEAAKKEGKVVVSVPASAEL